jgi:hypothetical protein
MVLVFFFKEQNITQFHGTRITEASVKFNSEKPNRLAAQLLENMRGRSKL